MSEGVFQNQGRLFLGLLIYSRTLSHPRETSGVRSAGSTPGTSMI